MPAKAVRSPSHTSARPQGRPPADKSILALAAVMDGLSEHIERLRRESDRLADGTDKKAMQWNRRLRAEASDAWWAAVDRLAALPARSWSGMAAKASAINATIQEREAGEDVTDIVVADTIIRLGASLAGDVLRWSGKRQ